ncbi:hypothetical protein SH1V18_43600 [Vallitalea longa]|uniref:Uncharacterized protein n=1 Tax=Vallitalea longa TaxID=2936439 RepID=A0A9W5YG45_9FIRM|nr:hypothetical protein [Vallitalea longa]GKX31880.1 hypothetical protein SH1V18_43600 [Vallitalea longa]
MKKNISISLMIILIFISVNVPVSANNSNNLHLIYKSKEIIDDETLIYKINNNISDKRNKIVDKDFIKIDGNNDLKVSDIKETTQLLITEKNNNTMSNTYVTNAYISVRKNSESTNDDTSISKETWDGSYSFSYKLTLYYKEISYNGNTYTDPIKVVSKILDHTDSSVRITRMHSKIGSGLVAFNTELEKIGLNNKVYEGTKTDDICLQPGTTLTVNDKQNYFFETSTTHQFVACNVYFTCKRGTGQFTISNQILFGSFPQLEL